MVLLSNLQSRRPSYTKEVTVLEMAGQRYRAVSRVVTAPKDTSTEPTYIPAANGFYEDSRIWGPLADRLARIALERREPLKLVTYEDSIPGHTADVLAFRAERLVNVIKATRSAPDDRMVMCGHSRGWISTVLAAAEQRGDVSACVGFGVAGLAPRDLATLTMRSIHEITAAEVLSELRVHTGLTDARSKVGVGRHLGSNALYSLAMQRADMYREARRILSADVVSQTAELSLHTPMKIWVHGQDAFFAATAITNNLTGADYRGDIQQVATSHLGPVMDLSLADDLYADIVTAWQADRVAAP